MQKHDAKLHSRLGLLAQRHKFVAFTLAEVLITLGIIGVVAAMTIPTLIKNTNQMELITKYKKTYSVLNSATKSIVALNGDLDTSSQANVTTQYKSVMNTSSDAAFNDGINFSPTKIYKYNKTNNNSGYNYSADANHGFVTNDGTSLVYEIMDSNCSITINGLTNTCGIWNIDVNGAKGPNMWGFDYYQVALAYRNGGYSIIPYGSVNDTQTCVVNSASFTTSNGCSTNALLDTLP